MKRPLLSKAECIQNCLGQWGLHPCDYLILLESRGLSRGTGLAVSFLLSFIGYLPTLRLQEGAKSPLEKSLFILVGVESDTADMLRADISYVYLGDHPCTATKLNGIVILFLSTSLCLFFYDTKTEKPNPLNNSYFDLQKTTSISSGQGKRVSSCIRVQEH